MIPGLESHSGVTQPESASCLFAVTIKLQKPITLHMIDSLNDVISLGDILPHYPFSREWSPDVFFTPCIKVFVSLFFLAFS